MRSYLRHRAYFEELRLFRDYRISLEFEKTGTDHAWVISPIWVTAVRLEAEHIMKPSSSMCAMALFFNPIKMERKMGEPRERLVKCLDSRGPDVIG